jgi:hypothetical protein
LNFSIADAFDRLGAHSRIFRGRVCVKTLWGRPLRAPYPYRTGMERARCHEAKAKIQDGCGAVEVTFERQ